jgi:diguanylate cyclase (GGDEF)-like protein
MAQLTAKTDWPDTTRTDAGLAACLVYIYPTGPIMGRRFTLPDGGLTLGRDDACGVCLAEASVSRRHATVFPAADGFAVTDLGSTNGTFVNEAPVAARHPLRDGDTVRVGNCILRYLAGGNVEAAYHEEIHRLAIVDGLTQTHNRRHLTEFLDAEVARAVRHGRPLSVLMFDIDKFKAINDTHGHLCGDHVLRELAARVRPEVRKGDVFARYGGEEFALVLVETPVGRAAEAAERLRAQVEAHPFAFQERPVRVTVSVGVAGLPADPAATPEALLAAADRRLYQAKEAGRNRVAAPAAGGGP